MNRRFLILALTAPAVLLASESGDTAQPKVARESLVLLKQAFSYQPAIGYGMLEKEEPSGEIVKMAPFIVVESLRQRELAAKLERGAQQKKDEEFTPIKGGTILEVGRMKIGTWPDPEGHPPGIKLIKLKF